MGLVRTQSAHRLEPNGQRIVFTLRTSVPLSGIVTMPDGTPAAGVVITATSDSQHLATTVSDQEGRFTIQVQTDPEGTLATHSSIGA